MSGLYSMIFGCNPQSSVILATLGLTVKDVGRFRDCYVAKGEIVVYTRNGGGNRDHWRYWDNLDEKGEGGDDCACPGCTITHKLPRHPCYLRDRDDDFDCTYATIYFRFPEEYAEGLRALDTGEKWDPDERWQTMLGALKGEKD